MLKLNLLACAAALLATSASAADYYVVVPVSRAAPAPVQALQVVLSPGSITPGIVGRPYSYDFAAHLQVTGDAQFKSADVSWAATSTLPAGLVLDGAGRLAGTPSAPGTANVAISATYKGKIGQQVYQLEIGKPTGLAQFGSYRAWADGTLAASCDAYRHPVTGAREYSGTTGDGVYRISALGRTLDVTCDMTKDGGGWTLVLNGVVGRAANWWSATEGYGTATNGTASSFKLGDSTIQALTTAGLRLSSPAFGITRYVKPLCRYSHQTAPSEANGCGVTYGTFAWTDARVYSFTVNSTNSVGGISDYRSDNQSMYFQTNDSREYAWWAGNNTTSGYRAGSGYGGGASISMWAR